MFTKIAAIIGALCLAFGLSGVVYGALSLGSANSTITGTIQVNPYSGGGGGGGGPAPTPTPTPSYSANATPANFSLTVSADSSGNATINVPATITVTDTSVNGTLTGVDNYTISGSLLSGLTLYCNDTLPVTFTDKTLTLHFGITGMLPPGTHNLTTGNPIISLNCY